jgi:type IV pilus assembly protein PilB
MRFSREGRFSAGWTSPKNACRRTAVPCSATGKAVSSALSTLPTVHGESLVIRLLDQTMPAQAFGATRASLPAAGRARCDRALAGPAGLDLSHRTDRFGQDHDAARRRSTRSITTGRVIHTLEDPVEYEFAASGRRRFAKRSDSPSPLAPRTPAAESRRAARRRNPRCGDRAARDSRGAHRPSGALDAAYERRPGGDSATARPRRGKFSAGGALRLSPRSGSCGGCAPSARNRIPKRPAARGALSDARAHFFRAVGCPACRGRGFAAGSPSTR